MMNPVLHLIWVWGGNVGLLLCTIAAIFRGRSAERWGAAILVVSWIATAVFDDHKPFQWLTVWIDVATCLAFAILSVVSRRKWVYVTTACQAVCVAVHFMAYMSPYIRTWAYITATGFWGGWAPLFTLGAGIATVKRDNPSHSLG